MAWVLEQRPELLEAAIAVSPLLVAISFGSPAPYIQRLHQYDIVVATQVHTTTEAVQMAQAGVDLLIIQGAEAGGHHRGLVSTLPLLQSVLDAVQIPVLAAGGIASPRGVAAALAAGAQGVWVGTCLLASPECENTARARARIVQAQETGTILTRVFDVAQGLDWPPYYPGRALRNQFTNQWEHQVERLANAKETRQQLAEARAQDNYDLAHLYAGEAVGMVTRIQAAGAVIEQLGEGAERLLRDRCSQLLAAPAQEAQAGPPTEVERP